MIAWLLIVHGNQFPEYNQALDYVQEARPVAGPNAGFTKALKNIDDGGKWTKTRREDWTEIVNDCTVNEVDFAKSLMPR